LRKSADQAGWFYQHVQISFTGHRMPLICAVAADQHVLNMAK
jgi:hypothetical protein